MTGKVYALSDLHGHYEALLAMLKKIAFSDSDRLYILGDCNDRDELIDITRLPKDKTDCGDREMRMKKFIENVRNPYCFAVGDIIVKSSFSEGSSLKQRIQELAASL